MNRSVRLAAILAVVAVVGAACAKESPTVTPTSTPTATPTSTVPGEVTIDQCVINQGSESVRPATGTTFTTKKAGTLLVGSDTTYPPFESISGGKAVGFDVDLITEIAKRLGLTAAIQTANFKTIFTALASHKYDVVISSVTIKEARKKTIDFTDPYYNSDQSLATDAAKTPEIRGVEDLTGKTVGAQDGTTGKDCADALKAQGKVGDVRAYPDILAAFSDLAAGRIAAIINDLPVSKRIVEERAGGLKIVQIIRTKEQYGVAVPKNNPNLREAINRALAALKADGSYRTLYVKWFKTEPPAE